MTAREADEVREVAGQALTMLALFRPWMVAPQQIENLRSILKPLLNVEVRPSGPVTDAEVDASALRGEPVALSLFRMFVREHDEGDGPERVTVEVADLRTVLRELEAAREVRP